MNSPDKEALVRAEVDRLLACIARGADHYEVLEISRDADIEKIRDAYCKAVEYLHPLKCRDLIEADGAMRWKLSQGFLRMVEAFSTLSRPARRIEYDASLNKRPITSLPIPPIDELPASAQNQASRRGKQRLASAFGKPEPSTAKTQDRRRTPRFVARLPLRVTADDGSWDEVTESHDVSDSGIGFRLAHTVERGTTVLLELPMPGELRSHDANDPIYRVTAVVKYTYPAGNDGNVVGVEFLRGRDKRT